MTFDGKVAHLWPDQCEGEDPLRAGGRAGWAGGRVAGAASASTAAAAAAQVVRSAAQRAAGLRSKSSRMLRSKNRSILKLLETARKWPRAKSPVSAHRISAARTRLRRPNEQQEPGHNFLSTNRLRKFRRRSGTGCTPGRTRTDHIVQNRGGEPQRTHRRAGSCGTRPRRQRGESGLAADIIGVYRGGTRCSQQNSSDNTGHGTGAQREATPQQRGDIESGELACLVSRSFPPLAPYLVSFPCVLLVSLQHPLVSSGNPGKLHGNFWGSEARVSDEAVCFGIWGQNQSAKSAKNRVFCGHA